MNKNVLITGGAGFIGSNLALHLLLQGCDVTVLDNLSPQIHADPDQSPLYQSIAGQVRFIHGDVRNREDWTLALADREVVVHFAAETGTGQSMYEAERYVDVNVRGTAILADLLTAGDHSIEKVIIASSRAIYGEGKYECEQHGIIFPDEREDHKMADGYFEHDCPQCAQPLTVVPTDEDSRLQPASVYGSTKLMQEQMLLNIGRSLKLPVVALRYQNVYGPGQSLVNPYTGILSIFSTRIKTGHDINVFEDGCESRDFVFIDDVVAATTAAIEKEGADFQALNVGSGVATTVLTVARTLVKLYGSQVEVEVSGNYRLGDIRHNFADLGRIGRALDWTPAVDFESGLRQFTEWVNQQDVISDGYDRSLAEMKARGLYK